MAKKKDDKKTTKLNDGINFDDLEDLDLDGGLDIKDLEDPTGASRKPSTRQIAKDVAKETGKGLLEGLAKEAAKKSLPTSYTDHYYDVLEYKDFAQTEYKRNKDKITKSVATLGTEAQKLLPFKIKMLDDFLEKYKQQNEQVRQASEDEQRTAAIQSSLSSIFDRQIDFQSNIEAKRDAKEEVKDKQELIRTKLTTDILTNIDKNISNQTGFTLSIAKEYFRKSLELQYKTYFIQADQLRTTREYFKTFSVQLDNIAKNTGLPEFVKIKYNERMFDVFRQEISKDIYTNVFSKDSYLGKIKAKIGGAIRGKVDDFTNNLDALAFNLSMMNMGMEGQNKMAVLPGILGSLAGSSAGEYLAGKIPEKYREKVRGNKYVKYGDNMLTSLANSPATFFKNLTSKSKRLGEEYEGSSSLLKRIAGKALGIVGDNASLFEPDKINSDVRATNSILNNRSPAIFDNRAYHSLTDVIPLYLAKILKENTSLRTMYYTVNADKLGNYKEPQELVFDYTKRKLTTLSKFRSNVETQVFKDKLPARINRLSQRLVSDMALNAKDDKAKYKLLSKNQSRYNGQLNEYLLKAKDVLGHEFSFENAVGGYNNDPTLKKYVEESPDLKMVLDTLREQKKIQSQKGSSSLSNTFKDFTSMYPIETIKEVLGRIFQLSKLDPKTYPLAISDEEALVIGKALTNFIINTSQPFSVENFANGIAFSYVEEKGANAVLSKIRLIISAVRRIKSTDNMFLESSLLAMLSLLEKSIRNNIEVDPNLFTKLNDYSPDLFQGKLSADNLVEGQLKHIKKTDYISSDQLSDLSFINRDDLKMQLSENEDDNLKAITERIFSRSKDMYEEFHKGLGTLQRRSIDIKEDLKSARSPKELASKIVKHTQDLYNYLEARVQKNYDVCKAKLDDISKDISNRAYDGIVRKLNDFEQELRTIKMKENDNFINKIMTLEEAKSQISDAFQSTDISNKTAEIESRIERERKLSEFKKKKIDQIINKIQGLKVAMASLDEISFAAVVSERFKELYDLFVQIKNDFEVELAKT